MDGKLIPGDKSNDPTPSTSQAKASPAPPILQSLELTRDERWYVVQALARREPIAKMRLEEQGYKIFLPQMIKTVRHARKMRQARVAVFPGYLFVALNPLKDRWRSINGTIGVARMIMANEGPAPVPRGMPWMARRRCRRRPAPWRTHGWPRHGAGPAGRRPISARWCWR